VRDGLANHSTLPNFWAVSSYEATFRESMKGCYTVRQLLDSAIRK
jgi:hypothetical protein